VIRYFFSVALVALAASGCAGAPDRDSANAPAAVIEPAAARANAAPSESVLTKPDLIIDVNELAARAPPEVVCRDTLKQGSNVIVRQCMTPESWKIYERRQAQEAAQIVRMMQGNPYR
jgi:hypothetical protein